MDGMTNYDNMLRANQNLCEEKKILAIDMIHRMLKRNEHVSVMDLTKATGLSRSYFYKNEQVRTELYKAIEAQQGKVLHSRRDTTLNTALKATVQVQKNEIERLKRENQRLTFALQRLETEQQNNTDFEFISKLNFKEDFYYGSLCNQE